MKIEVEDAVNLWLAKFGERLPFGEYSRRLEEELGDYKFWGDVYRTLEKNNRISTNNAANAHFLKIDP